MTKIAIYVLCEPETDQVRYVGKTKQSVKVRLGAHLRGSKKKKTHKECWIAGLLARNLRPTLKVIEVCEDADWEQRERFWIAFYRAQGLQLCNRTDGGEGGPTEVEWSDERRALQSQRTAEMNKARAGQPWSIERKEQQSADQKRRWQRSEERAAQRQKMQALCAKPEYRAKQSVSVARSWTPERREKQAAVAQRVNADPARKLKQAALMAEMNRARKGMRRSSEPKTDAQPRPLGTACLQHAGRHPSREG